MNTLAVILVLLAVGATSFLLLERRPGCGAWYGLAKLTGARLNIGPVDWASLTRHATPNDALVCEAARCPQAKPDWEPKTYAMPPGELLARLREVAFAEHGTRELAPTGVNTARFIQYTRLMRFPDTIDVEVFAADPRCTLAIYSRSLIGRNDFGVNRARVERWLAGLDSQPA
jgi:uncharacterized protein (DUF1499 family)